MKRDLLQHLRQSLIQFQRARPYATLGIALSGGVDSSVLAHLTLRLRSELPPLTWLHVNYHFRPESDLEEAHLRAWAEAESMPFVSHSVQLAEKPRNLQAWARQERYRFFAQTLPADAALCVAQQRDDQVETILLKLLRAPSLGSLAGMRRVERLDHLNGEALPRPLTIFRPLLDVPRSVILDYAQRQDLRYFEDSSNATLDYRRNRVRHQILPLLVQENPRFAEQSLEIARQVREAEAYLQARARRWLRQREGENLPREALSALPGALQSAVLKMWIQQRLPDYAALALVLKRLRKALRRGLNFEMRLTHPWLLRLKAQSLSLERDESLPRSFRG